jgi:hypothetical protein
MSIPNLTALPASNAFISQGRRRDPPKREVRQNCATKVLNWAF